MPRLVLAEWYAWVCVARYKLLEKTSTKMHKCTHKQTGSQQPLALADTLAISTVSLFWLHAFHSKRRIIYIICVFPKWCEQAALSLGFLLANVSNWPWERKKNIHKPKAVASIMGFSLVFFVFFFKKRVYVQRLCTAACPGACRQLTPVRQPDGFYTY